MGVKESVTLYRHTDGYPERIVSDLHKAYKFSGGNYTSGRTGKVASYLCAVEPGVFEPQSGHTINEGIEYYYKLYLVNRNHGNTAERPVWDLEIFIPKFSELKTVQKRVRLEDLVKKDLSKI